MRNLTIGFIGVALPLALAAPTWAQAPATNAPSPTVAPLTTMAEKNTCTTRHKHYGRAGGGTSGDHSANALNAQELSRLQGGAPPPPPPMR
jgi:hypothetical protein